MPATDWEGLTSSPLGDVLGQARQLGFLGPGPLEPHLRHAAAFTRAVRSLELHPAVPSPALLDLGSGGGLPGLVMATLWPESSVTLLDANERRATFLERSVAELALGNAKVLWGRAETLGREQGLRGTFQIVVARSFGAPAVLAECGAPFLGVGGWLAVSEPPEESSTEAGASRWPTGPLAEFGLAPVTRLQEEFSFQILQQRATCPDRYPRRDGVPSKKPRF